MKVFGMFGLSPIELLVVGIVALLTCGVPIAAVVVVIAIARRAATGGFKPPSLAGAPRIVRSLDSSDPPISGGARWIGNELEVTADEAGPQRLFEVPLDGIDQSMITYRFRIQTNELRSKVYPEMWCRVAGIGQAFSRGLNQKVRGTNNRMTIEIPFYLKRGELADLVKLNLVFEGPGAVRLMEIEVLATPLA